MVTPNEFRAFQRVLVAYDGGIESNKALKTACELFAASQTALSVVFVSNDADRSRELDAEVEEFVGPYKINVERVLLKGDPGREILNYAEANAIDLIVMGAFSHSRIHELILGGTTASIIRRSIIPILLNR